MTILHLLKEKYNYQEDLPLVKTDTKKTETVTKKVPICTIPELASYKTESTIIRKLRNIHEAYPETELKNLLEPARKLQIKALLTGTRPEQIKFTYIYDSILKVLSEDPEELKRKKSKKNKKPETVSAPEPGLAA